MPVRRRITELRQAWRERTIQALLSVALWWAIYWRVAEGYGMGSGVIAATCTAWGYIILSSYATHVLNARAANSDHPRTPGGRWPGARP